MVALDFVFVVDVGGDVGLLGLEVDSVMSFLRGWNEPLVDYESCNTVDVTQYHGAVLPSRAETLIPRLQSYS